MITKKLLEKKPLKRKIILTPLFPFIYVYYWFKMILTPPIERPGIHAIVGETGSGKTLLSSILSKQFIEKGRTVYSNSQFNSKVKKIDILDYFHDMEQHKPLKNGIVMLDEIQRTFNKRLNRRNDYNEVFIPMIEWLSTHRHEGITHVYFITQAWGRLDLQIQDFIHKIHFVNGRKASSLKAWHRDKKLRPLIRPKKIKYYTSRKKDIEKSDIDTYVRRGKLKYRKPRKYTVKVPLHELSDFNTYAFKNKKWDEKPQKKEAKK